MPPGGYERVSLPERFWAKVERRGADECWPWTKGTDRQGYGRFQVGKRSEKAHRQAWSLAHPTVELHSSDHICHRCDNPPCCNPAHLYRGNHAANMRDMVARGRQTVLRGDAWYAAHPNRKRRRHQAGTGMVGSTTAQSMTSER
jgi:hypothetical protein